jgi:hypothetical protein
MGGNLQRRRLITGTRQSIYAIRHENHMKTFICALILMSVAGSRIFADMRVRLFCRRSQMKMVKICCFLFLMMATVILRGNSENTETRSNMLPIICKLRCYRQDQHVWADITFTNSTETTISVFEEGFLKVKELEGAGFWVKRGSIRVPYTGILVKRPPPRIEEFYSMKPHEVIKTKVEISKYFDFTKAGEYTIGYSCITEMLPLNNTNLIKIESNTAVLKQE